jgi:hypothetical protein
MHYKEVIAAIRSLYEDELLNPKKKQEELDKIDKELDHLKEKAASIFLGVREETEETIEGKGTITSIRLLGAGTIEHNIEWAKIDGLRKLREQTENKGKGKIKLPLSLIRDISYDEDIKYAGVVQNIVTAYLAIQNKEDKKTVLNILKSSLASIFIDVGESKRVAADKAANLINLHFLLEEKGDIKPPNTRKKGDRHGIDTGFGHLTKLP